MKLPIGILVYAIQKINSDDFCISAIWYYSEMDVPSTIEDKKRSVIDLKEKRCVVILILGSFDQIIDILSQGDSFFNGEIHEVNKFKEVINQIEMISSKAYLFDDVYHPKGTSLMIDTVIDVNESMDEVMQDLNASKGVTVTLNKDWSLTKDLLGSFESSYNEIQSTTGKQYYENLTDDNPEIDNSNYMISAGELLFLGHTSFEDFVLEMTELHGENVKPFLKSVYISSYYWQDNNVLSGRMDSREIVETSDIDFILRKKESRFRFENEDYLAIKICKRIMHKLLSQPNVTPEIIIGIGHYLYALERLPMVTIGANISVTIEYTIGNIRERRSDYYVFLINNEIFHIEVAGYVHDEFVGGDSISYPGWYVEKDGGRDTEMDLSSLEDNVDEYLSLGAKVSVEDYSEMELE